MQTAPAAQFTTPQTYCLVRSTPVFCVELARSYSDRNAGWSWSNARPSHARSFAQTRTMRDKIVHLMFPIAADTDQNPCARYVSNLHFASSWSLTNTAVLQHPSRNHYPWVLHRMRAIPSHFFGPSTHHHRACSGPICGCSYHANRLHDGIFWTVWSPRCSVLGAYRLCELSLLYSLFTTELQRSASRNQF